MSTTAFDFIAEDADALHHEEVEVEIDRERVRREARAALDAESARDLTWWEVDEFLAAPGPDPLIDGFLYRDSLGCLFGPPGCGKTFLALDMGMRVALGWPWAEREVIAGPVVYVMAEGQAVNGDRVRAWLGHHRVNAAALHGRFAVVPHAVLLTPPALGDLIDRVEAFAPALIILDTKNAMMLGNEDSAQDWATTRRALDALREACRAAVVLVDHTGHGEQERPRGSSAQIAAYDTIVKVEKVDASGAPAILTARVTRDKAAEAGTVERFHLRLAPPAAVPVHTAATANSSEPRVVEWHDQPIPPALADAEGPGARAVPDLARYMLADRAGDRGEVGVTQAEARRAIGASEGTARRAWSWLLKDGWIVPTASNARATPFGRHRWADRPWGER